MRRRAGALAGAAALALVPPAAASQFRVDFDDRPAELVTVAFERGVLSERLGEEILEAEGYRLLFEHVARARQREPEEIRREFAAALEAAIAGERRPGFSLELVRARPERYRDTLGEFRRAAGILRWRITDRINEYLPPLSGFASTAHLVIGGSAAGLAFGDRSDVVLRLDDFVPRDPRGSLDADRLASVLAHELFHVGFRAAGGLPPRPEPPDGPWIELASTWGSEVVGEVWRASGLASWDGEAMRKRFAAWRPPPEWEPRALDRFVALLSRLQNEGCAVYVEAPLRDPGETGRHRGEIARWMAAVEEDFGVLAHVSERLAHGASAEEIDRLAREGFAGSGPLYRVGFRMAERVDRLAGRRPFVSAVAGGPLEFVETYLQTHPYGPGQVDPRTAEVLARVIRELRAVGAFDPEG